MSKKKHEHKWVMDDSLGQKYVYCETCLRPQEEVKGEGEYEGEGIDFSGGNGNE